MVDTGSQISRSGPHGPTHPPKQSNVLMHFFITAIIFVVCHIHFQGLEKQLIDIATARYFAAASPENGFISWSPDATARIA